MTTPTGIAHSSSAATPIARAGCGPFRRSAAIVERYKPAPAGDRRARSAPRPSEPRPMSDLRHRTLAPPTASDYVVGRATRARRWCCSATASRSWYSWRHQLPVLSGGRLPRGRAGHARLRPDRKARDVHAYTQLHHVGDMVGVLDAFDAKTRDHHRPRLGRTGRVERGRAASRPLHRDRGAQRAVVAMRTMALFGRSMLFMSSGSSSTSRSRERPSASSTSRGDLPARVPVPRSPATRRSRAPDVDRRRRPAHDARAPDRPDTRCRRG